MSVFDGQGLQGRLPKKELILVEHQIGKPFHRDISAWPEVEDKLRKIGCSPKVLQVLAVLSPIPAREESRSIGQAWVIVERFKQ